DAGGYEDRPGQRAADETGDGSPRQRAKCVDAGAFGLAIERVGFHEEAEPEAGGRGGGGAENQAVEGVGAERGEEGRRVVGRPIEGEPREPGKKGEVAEEPPKNRVGHAPAHARAVAANVALEEKSKRDAQEKRDGEMEKDDYGAGRFNAAVAGEKRVIVS